MYATYDYYKEEYGGEKLSEKEFNRYARRASWYLDALCGGKIPKEVPEAVIDACCAISEIYSATDTQASVISENTDGYVITYREESHVEKLACKAAYDYLFSTGLLFAGAEVVCRC